MKIEYGRVKFFSVRRLWPKWAVVQVVGYGDSERDYVVARFWQKKRADREASLLNFKLNAKRYPIPY